MDGLLTFICTIAGTTLGLFTGCLLSYYRTARLAERLTRQKAEIQLKIERHMQDLIEHGNAEYRRGYALGRKRKTEQQ